VAPRTGTRLVIVESPAKARTIAGYLGAGYVVESSIGHIRDLPHNAAEVPAKFKGEPWPRIGVDVDHGFEPIYVVPPDKKSHITKLKKLLKDADELYLATDEDREGEAIAWHLLDELKPRVPVHRMVFHEITPAAIQAAVDSPRDIDQSLVNAQETRRILDRLYGYEVSPVLWKKVMSGLSAGRVQSVATRLVVSSERERIAFRSASYWDLQATMDAGAGADPRQFPARLVALDGTGWPRAVTSPAPGAGARARGGAPRRGAHRRSGHRASRPAVHGPLRRGQALHPQALRAVSHHDAAAGGQPQARLRRVGDDADRAAAVRERLHHLHAHRLGHLVGRGHHLCPQPGTRAVRPRSTCPDQPRATPPR
jgi:DNA topoisomerase-1